MTIVRFTRGIVQKEMSFRIYLVMIDDQWVVGFMMKHNNGSKIVIVIRDSKIIRIDRHFQNQRARTARFLWGQTLPKELDL